jgi:serine protease Do
VLDKPRTTYALDDGVRFAFVGGPVIDAQGRIAGVVGFDLSTQEGGDIYVRSGHPLVYQTSLLQPYIDAPPLQKQPETTANDAWLGVFTQPLTEDYAAYWNLPLDGGLIVSTVVPGSPAGRAGLQPGDIITEFAGTPISAKLDRDVLGFTKLVRDAGAGKTVEVKFLRGGQPQAVSLLLETRPRTSQDAEEYEDKTLGMTLRELTADVKIQLNLADDVQGIIVRSVESGSAAQLAKIRPGVILLAFGDTPVRNLEEYRKMMEALSKEKPAEITVFARAGAITGFFRLQPRWEE